MKNLSNMLNVFSQAALKITVMFLCNSGNAQEKVIFDEHFENNNKQWPLYSRDTEARAEIKDGYFFMGSRVNEWYYSTIPVTVNQNSDFQIQCTIKKISGVDNYFYGLIWGLKDGTNFYNLAITGDGRIAVTKKERDKFIDFMNASTPNQYVNLGNAVNEFRIKKAGNHFEFFVNDYAIYKMPFQPFLGSNIGFILYNKMQLAIDDLIITTKAEVSQITKTPTVVEGSQMSAYGDMLKKMGYGMDSTQIKAAESSMEQWAEFGQVMGQKMEAALAKTAESVAQQQAKQIETAQQAVSDELKKQGLGELVKQMEIEEKRSQTHNGKNTLMFVTKMVELKEHTAYLNQIYSASSTEFKQKLSSAIVQEEISLRASKPDSDVIALIDGRRKMEAEQNSAVGETILGGLGDLFEAAANEEKAFSESGGFDPITEAYKEDNSEPYRQAAQEARERAAKRRGELLQRSAQFSNAIAVAEKALFEKIRLRYGYKHGPQIVAVLNSYWHGGGTPIYKSYADWEQTKMKGRRPATARNLGPLGAEDFNLSGSVTPTLWEELYIFRLTAPTTISFSARLQADQQSPFFQIEIYEISDGKYILKETPKTLNKSVELPAGKYLVRMVDHSMSLTAKYELQITLR